MSIRLRLSIWYSAIFGITLALLSTGLYVFMAWHLQNMVRDSVISRAEHLASAIVVVNEANPGSDVRLVPLEAFEDPEVFVQVWSADDKIIATSSNLTGRQLNHPAASPRPVYVELEGIRMRQVMIPVTSHGVEIAHVQLGVSLRQSEQVLSGLRWLLVLGGIAAIGGVSIASAAAARRVLRPVADMTETARAIALSKGFSRRLEAPSERDELGQLATTFNEMLSSLEHAYDSQRRFTADASHEIRAPLTAIRGNLELIERIPDMSPDDRERAVGQALREVERLARLVNDLLGLARADAGQAIRSDPVELDTVAIEVQREASHLSDVVSVEITHVMPAVVRGDRDRLKELFLVLTDNAVRYTPPGGSVTIDLRSDGPWVTFVVEDTGIGIDAADLPHVFERFWRADRARSRDSGGTGLGLAIARWIVDHHNGEIHMSSLPGRGTRVTVRLPADAQSATV